MQHEAFLGSLMGGNNEPPPDPNAVLIQKDQLGHRPYNKKIALIGTLALGTCFLITLSERVPTIRNLVILGIVGFLVYCTIVDLTNFHHQYGTLTRERTIATVGTYLIAAVLIGCLIAVILAV